MPRYLGRGQIAECQRCGFKVKRASLVEDGYVAGLLVCVSCYDAEHPQDYPALPRPEGLPPLRPAPENLPSPTVPVLDGSVLPLQVSLSWTPSDANHALVNQYILSRSADGGEFGQIATVNVIRDQFGALNLGSLVYVDTLVTGGVSYRYTVAGHPVSGPDSPASNIAGPFVP